MDSVWIRDDYGLEGYTFMVKMIISLGTTKSRV